MAKAVDDTVLDAALDEIATCTRLVVCSGQPANFAGIAAVALADVTLTAGDGNGDYVIANGDTNGRKLTVGAQTAVDIDTTGTATHVTLDNGSVLKYVTTCTSQALVDTGTVDVPAWDIEIADPT
jgi:hypothetical protein